MRVHRLEVTVTVDADGRSVISSHTEMRATNDAAAMKLGQIPINYDASLARLDIIGAYTLKPDGTKIPVDVSAIYDQLAPGTTQVPMFNEFHMKTIVFPQFSAGDTAVYTLKFTAKEAIFPGQFFYGEAFSPTTAYDSVEETVEAPDSLHLQVETHGVELSKHHDDGRTIYHWHYSAPAPEAPGTFAISQIAKTPRFFVSTFRDYAALGAAYAASAAPKMAVTPPIQALADKITKGITDRRAKAKALYEWVSKNIRYVGVELGRGAVVPHAAQQVLTNGYGDCKDHVTLLGAFLKAEGIESEGVLIDSGTDYALTDVPTLTGLNHIITYVPEFDLYLDSTAAVAPFGALPFDEYGKPVVYTSVKDSRRGTMPVLPAGQADLYTKTDATLARDGTLTGTTATTGRGAYQIPLRGIALNAQTLGPETTGAKLMAGNGYGGDATGTFTAPSPTAPSDSYTTTGTFKAVSWKEQAQGSRRFLLPGGMRVAGVSGNGLMGQFGNTGLKDDASTPCYSGHEAEDLSLTAPGGMAFDHVPKDVHVTTSYIRFDAHWTLAGNTLSVHRDFTSRIDQALCTPDIRKTDKDALKKISDSYDEQLSLDPVNGQLAAQPAEAASDDATVQSDTHAEFQQMYQQARTAALQDHKLTKSIRLLTKILKLPGLTPSDVYTVRLARAPLYLSTDQISLALNDLNAVLARTPDLGFALSARAHIHMMRQEPHMAMKDFNRLLENAPHNDEALFSRATIELQLHHYADAVRDLDAVLQDNPKDAAAREMRGVADVKLGRYDSASSELGQARSSDSAAPLDLSDSCTALSHSHRPRKALKPCMRMVRDNPYSGVGRSGLGIVYFRMGKYHEALRELRTASRTYPNNAEYLYGLGAVESKLGDTADGQRDMNRAEKITRGIGRRLRRIGVAP